MSSNLADYIQIMTCSYDLFIKDILMWGKKKILTLKKKKNFLCSIRYTRICSNISNNYHKKITFVPLML